METIFQPCGNGDNVCKCKSASECGYGAKTNSDSLTWEEAKNEVAKLYASSRVRALEEEFKKYKEEVRAKYDELDRTVRESGHYAQKLEEENKRLQERLETTKTVVCKTCGTHNLLKP